jgi:hypothetical protein
MWKITKGMFILLPWAFFSSNSVEEVAEMKGYSRSG